MNQEMTGWQWHQLDHMQIIWSSLQTDNYASTPSLKQEAQLPQRDRATPRTHFTRDQQTDRRKDGQKEKAIARTRYAVCVAHKKGLRSKKPTEKIAGQRSYTVGGHRFWYQWGHQMQVFCITEEVDKQSELRNDISTECISRHILYEQKGKSLHEKKVMVSAIANN